MGQKILNSSGTVSLGGKSISSDSKSTKEYQASDKYAHARLP